MAKTTPEQCRNCTMFSDSDNFCAKLTPAELIELNANSCLVSIDRDETIHQETMRQHPVLAVSSGVLSVQQILHDGRRTIAAILMRGDILDLRKLAKNQIGTLVALTKVELCRLSPKVFDNSIATNPQARTQAWENLTKQAYRAISHASDLAKKQALEKLASFIFECRARMIGETRRDHVQIPIRRRDLADYLGMQPETVSRCFRELEDRGIIEVSGFSLVRLANIPALRRIANGDRVDIEPGAIDRVGYRVLVGGT